MEKIRKLCKHCSIGEYEFDIAINRNITLVAFEKNKKFWDAIQKVSGNVKMSDGNLETDNMDLETISNILQANDDFEEYKPEFVKTIFPMMLESAQTELDIEKFYKYCAENEVDDIFDDEIVKFAMLGFTDDKNKKNPKVKVSIA